MVNRLGYFCATAVLILAGQGTGTAGELSNDAFQIQYDGRGISSLKHTDDVHDTEYLAVDGILGKLHVRYRSTTNGHWQDLREMASVGPRLGRSEVGYRLGRPRPSLAAQSIVSAAVRSWGLRALNDGQVPDTGRSRGGPGPGSWGGGGNRVEPLTLTGARGELQWVQYTFPVEEDVSRSEVFWAENPAAPDATGLPLSWRLLYLENREWKEVRAQDPYELTPNAFNIIEFEPVRTLALRMEVRMAADANVGIGEWRVGSDPVLEPPEDLLISQDFRLDGDVLSWTITLSNDCSRSIEIGDLAVPLDFSERTRERGTTYTTKLLRHALIAGHGSWVYWQRSGGEGPYLVMTPMGDTKFEYYDESRRVFTPFIHARLASAEATASGGNWRLPITGLELAPKGSPGSEVKYSFRFQWAKDFAAVRDVLYREGKFDTVVVPGMTIPIDLPAMISLRTQNRIEDIRAEFPESTTITSVRQKPAGARLYRVQFAKLGENMLTIRYAGGKWASLEFFVTEPLETVIKKRAAFLVSHHQHKDPGKWYYGTYSDWDEKNEILRGPEDRDGLSTWLTDANDDAGNARPAYIASKNVFFPNQEEIHSLEIYLSKYLWGGMQMTDREKYPYGIYGIPNFKVNRESDDEGRRGRAHLWRIYDYPHIIMLYYRMYQIATFYPETVHYLTADQYLERAYRTALAYWTVPLETAEWSADDVGTMNEAFLPELIQTLEETGRQDWADTLRGYWEGKVEHFINETPNLYVSEFSFDSTGFESTGAFSKYAMEHVIKPGEAVPSDLPKTDFRRRVTYDGASRFMDAQLLLNLCARGWLETTYYQLGSDYRGSMTYLLSYMSHLGGWSILDYGLHFAKDPTDYLRLGYASSLSAWALVNSGTAESNYGYWNPGKENDGATGGGFIPVAMGRGWIGKEMARGAWYYSAEEDVGYCGALRTHATIVTKDPLFGEMAYGGLLTRRDSSVEVIPRDGLRVRFYVVRDGERLFMTLDRDGFAREQPVVVDDGLGKIRFVLGNRAGQAHDTGLTITGLPAGEYTVNAGDRTIATLPGGSPVAQRISIPVSADPTLEVVISRAGE